MQLAQNKILPWFIYSGQKSFVKDKNVLVDVLKDSSFANGKIFDKSKDEDFIEQSRIVNKAGMKQLEQGFDALGLNYVPSRANFILVDVQADPAQTFTALLKEGVIVRPVGIPNHLRVSIGTEAENAKFLTALAKVLNLTSSAVEEKA